MASSISQLGVELLIFVAVLAAAEGALLLLFGGRSARRRAAMDRLRRHATQLQDAEGTRASILRDAPPKGVLAGLAARLSRRASIELLLYRAGLPWTLGRFCALIAGVAAAGLLLACAMLPLPLALAAGAAAGVLPLLYAASKARGRMRRFEEQLPDALDLMCRALRAGISLEYGFKSAGEELPDPIGTEFGQVAHEISLGLPLRAALEHLSERARSRDLPFFTTAVLIQRETGGNLAEILENLSKVVRERLQFQLKLRAILAQMQLTSNLLSLVPIAFGVLISIASPGYLDPLFETPVGRHFLYTAIALVVFGWLMCRRLSVVRM